ncbi:hypothetical protein DL96DRAFT_1814701 [Flagelloscypha sp. PMI_526]|nr:hypothetical protein DL96DRAFT_1814701 [Flagelloscypha sp. PMI_526]
MAVHLRRPTHSLDVHSLPLNGGPGPSRQPPRIRQRPSPNSFRSIFGFGLTFRRPRLRLSVLLGCVFCTVLLCGIFDLSPRSMFGANTLVYRREDLQRIWSWEIRHFHHPSKRPVPKAIGLVSSLENPAVPRKKDITPFLGLGTQEDGVQREYLDLISRAKVLAYPVRPPSGSAADLDKVFEQCDFSQNKFVRDCLAFLSSGAGLDHGKRPRKQAPQHKQHFDPVVNKAHYIYKTNGSSPLSSLPTNLFDILGGAVDQRAVIGSERDDYIARPYMKSNDASWETLPVASLTQSSPPPHCDPENPRLFHMYWTGAFNDKPYLTILSFLYTQNLGLSSNPDPSACRPQLWFWINPGQAAALDSDMSEQEMHEFLAKNQWSAPFLHQRFADVIKFKLWVTGERLDAVPELRNEWRSLDTIFNPGGWKIIVPYVDGKPVPSTDDYDRISATLSDIARFVLCHQFGGIYLDTDSLFLRDWEDLWGWGGAFSYRWSYHDAYNTAVIRLNKGSLLGTFLLRTALKNGFDFHPMSISKYLKEAHLDDLLYRLPDALFDAAWLNTEGYQRDKPPRPYFPQFPMFWQPGLPEDSGFDQFFRGSWSYHYHNAWSAVVDQTQNYPNLGPRFWHTLEFMPTDGRQPVRSPSLSWSAVMKRTFEAYVRGDAPNMYGEWLAM